MWLIPYIVAITCGLLIGRAKSPATYQVMGLVILAFLYACWLQYTTNMLTGVHNLLNPAVVDFVGRVVVFFVLSAIGSAISGDKALT